MKHHLSKDRLQSGYVFLVKGPAETERRDGGSERERCLLVRQADRIHWHLYSDVTTISW